MNDRDSLPAVPSQAFFLRHWRALLGALLLILPLQAFAQLALTVAGDGQYEYDSNVFDLRNGDTAALPVKASGLSDSFYAYGGKLNATYLWSQQQFHAAIVGTEYRYDRFTILDHSEFTLDGGWNWKLGRTLDGLLEVTRTRSMVSLENLVAAQLALQTEQRETAKIGWQVTPDWRTEAAGYVRDMDEPIEGDPNLSLRETSGSAAVKYTGTAGITAGITAGYLRGNYSGNTQLVNGVIINFAPSYHQDNVALTATDIVTGKSTFVGSIGYSKRTSADTGASELNNASGVTGELDYRRALTAKTTIDLGLSRQIGSYVTNTASSISSIAALTVNWQATNKIAVTLGYNYTYQQLPGQGDVPPGATVGLDRTDRMNFISLGVDYQALRWLDIRPYARYQDRSSKNFVEGDFNGNIVGVMFTLQWERGVAPPPPPFTILTPQ